MALFFQQTDTDGSCGTIVACSGATSVAFTAYNKLSSIGGTAGTVANTHKIDTGLSNRAFAMFQGAPSLTTWAAGTWQVRFNITTANTNVTLQAVYVCRVNASCTNQATVGSVTGIGLTLTAGNIATWGTTGIAVTGAVQSASASDLFYVVLVGDAAADHGKENILMTHNKIIDMPEASAARRIFLIS